jgi:PAC2 family
VDDVLRCHVQPDLHDASLLLAFEGWNDAGEAASSAARFFSDAVQGAPLAELDPEEFYDFTVNRPRVLQEQGKDRRIEWPSVEFRYGALCDERALVVGVGPEPHLRWRRFTEEVLGLARRCKVRRAVLLGAFLADVVYSRPVRVSGSSSVPETAVHLALEPSGYEGPTGIVGVLAEGLRGEGVEVVSLWAGLPHYIEASPNPRGALALVQKASSFLRMPVDETPLRDAAAEFEEHVSALVASDPALSEYVRALKKREFAQ